MVDTTGTTAYTYDALYQLTGVTYPNADAQSYTYDAMGNRLTRVHNAVTTNYSYDDADQMTLAGASAYTYDANGNQTAAGTDTFSWDAQDRMAGTVFGGVASTYAYNGDGLRTSRTIGGATASYTWDQNASLPQILKDSTGNRYVYGLDLISKTNSGGTQEYHLTDGLGSTTGLATGAGSVTDAYTYDVYGAQRTRTGTSGNEFTFAGEQRDAHGGIAPGIQRLPLDQVVSSTNLTGATVANLDDDPDAPDAAWATATTVADTSLRVGFPTPLSGKPTPGAGRQEFRVQLRKNASAGNNPTYDIQIWETGGSAPLATLASGVTLSSSTGAVVSVTWNAALLGQANGSAVELVIVGHVSGGAANKQRTVEVGAVEWNVNHQGTPAAEFYYLRARYYDAATGRFASRDPLPFMQRYAYVGGNPVNYVDPLGLCRVCDFVSDKGADVKDWGTDVVDHPGSIIQLTIGTNVALTSTGDRSRVDGVTFYEHCKGTCSVPFAGGAGAITLGHSVFIAGTLKPRVRQHELAHVSQGDRYGISWIPAYMYEQLRVSPNCRFDFRCYERTNRFEKEALQAEDKKE